MDDVALRFLQLPDEIDGILQIEAILLDRRGQAFDDVLDRNVDAVTLAAQAVDQLVADDGRQPGADRPGRIPGAALASRTSCTTSSRSLGRPP